MKLSDWYEELYPTHDRTSCNDEDYINVDPDGTGCRRCNAILFTHYRQLKSQQDHWLQLAASMYQAAGTFNLPIRFLDILSAAANGEPFDHMLESLLPVSADEGGVWDENVTN